MENFYHGVRPNEDEEIVPVSKVVRESVAFILAAVVIISYLFI